MTINLTLDLNDCNIISSYKILEFSGLGSIFKTW